MLLFLGQFLRDRAVTITNYHFDFTLQRLVFNQWGGLRLQPKKDPDADIRKLMILTEFIVFKTIIMNVLWYKTY